jgi:RNAse (barnase) inhibitor barstar
MLEKHHYKVDFSNIKDFWDIHTTLEKDLKLFDYSGDLDSLYDCLTDKLCYFSTIEIHGLDKLKKYDNYDKRLLEVFYEAKHDWGDEFSNRFFVTIVHKDGTHEEIK